MKELHKKQPKALSLLFFSELWERFGFYTVQSLMVLYLSNVINFSDQHAFDVTSGFGALLYISPVIGGWLADKLLGFQRAVIFGFLLYIFGYFMLESQANIAFYFSLALLIAGNGYFKANISSLLGTIYEKNDPRRDRGFTIFYMGINIGSVAGPIAAAFVQKYYGYHAAFAMCGVGLAIGFVVFLSARKHLLGDHGLEPMGELLHQKSKLKKSRLWTYVITLLVAGIICFILPHPEAINYGIILFSIAAIVYVIIETLKLSDKKQRRHLFALMILIIYSIAFWAYYMQTFFSITLFIERHVNRDLFGWNVPTELFATFSSIFLIVLIPFFIRLWRILDRRNKNPAVSIKFALAMVFMALSFFVINLADHFSKTGLISLYWILLAGFVREIGEILLSPIGLSAVTNLSPKKLTGLMMGLWFLALGAAIAISGKLADTAVVSNKSISIMQSLHVYNHAFWGFGYVSLLIAIITLLVAPLFNRLTGEKLLN